MKNSCVVLAKLRQELTNAIQDVYRLRAESQVEKSGNDKQAAILNLLQEAREDLREAKHALWHHVKEHHCTE